MPTPSSPSTDSPGKPPPVPDERSEDYWRSTSDGVLALQRCTHCGHFAHPPVLVCPACQDPHPSFRFEPVSGRGVIRTWTVMHMAFLPAFEADVPWVIVHVELEEQPGLRFLATLVDGPDAEFTIGSPVEVVFETLPGGLVLPQFQLVRAAP
jgi:uncharacterized protein